MEFRTLNDIDLSLAQDLFQLNRYCEAIAFPPAIESPQHRYGIETETWKYSMDLDTVGFNVVVGLVNCAG